MNFINVNANKFAEIWIYQSAVRHRMDIDAVFTDVVAIVNGSPSIGWRRDTFFLYDWMDDSAGINIHNIRDDEVLKAIRDLTNPKLFKSKTLVEPYCVMTECTLNDQVDHTVFAEAAVRYFFRQLFQNVQNKTDEALAHNVVNRLVSRDTRVREIFTHLKDELAFFQTYS